MPFAPVPTPMVRGEGIGPEGGLCTYEDSYICGMLDYALPLFDHRQRADDYPEAYERDRPSCLAEQAPRVDSEHQPGSAARRHQHGLPLKMDEIDLKWASIERLSKVTID